jgi:hypothetical protein
VEADLQVRTGLKARLYEHQHTCFPGMSAPAGRQDYRVKRSTPRADDSTSVEPDCVTVLSLLSMLV